MKLTKLSYFPINIYEMKEINGSKSIGRPSKFLLKRAGIINSLRRGYTLSSACRMNNISYQTVNRWVKRGKEDGLNDNKSDHFFFYKMVTKARQKFQNYHISYYG